MHLHRIWALRHRGHERGRGRAGMASRRLLVAALEARTDHGLMSPE